MDPWAGVGVTNSVQRLVPVTRDSAPFFFLVIAKTHAKTLFINSAIHLEELRDRKRMTALSLSPTFAYVKLTAPPTGWKTEFSYDSVALSHPLLHAIY